MAKTLARKKSTAKPAAKAKAISSKVKTSGARGATGARGAKYVYLFGKKTDGNGSMKPLLGGKGANLAEMCRIGLPVPPGFTITTEVCTYYYANKKQYPKELQAQMEAGVANMEKIMGTKFGATNGMPLLVAVRSGARDSMPGMMDTILNLGLNDQTVIALEKATNNPRFAWDCYRRFIQMYGDVVLGVILAPLALQPQQQPDGECHHETDENLARRGIHPRRMPPDTTMGQGAAMTSRSPTVNAAFAVAALAVAGRAAIVCA